MLIDQIRTEESLKAWQEGIQLLIRAANLNRRLIEDRDWQQAMTFANKVLASMHGGEQPNQLRLFDVAFAQ